MSRLLRLVPRSVINIPRRGAGSGDKSDLSKPPVEPDGGRYDKITDDLTRPPFNVPSGGWPAETELWDGMFKKEMLAYLDGNKDPFNVLAIDRNKDHAGTKEDPNLVPSAFESRLMACICAKEDCHTIFPMWLHQGEPKRCLCGHWFKLYYVEPFVDMDLL